MIIFIKTKFVLIFFLALTFVCEDKQQKIQSRCQNMLQKSGQCTKCQASRFLYKGDCYNKLRGCQDYISDKICLSCQSGYTLSDGVCIKEAIFFRLQKADIPPVKINIEGELTYRDIEERIGDSRKGMFQIINRHFKDNYALNLSSCSINNVKYIETINGVIFTIYYRSLMKIYEAVAFIDSKRDSKRNKIITELQFSQKSVIPSYSLEQINSGLKKQYEDILKDCLLSTIQKMTENRYKISYVNSKGLKYQSLFKKQPFQQIDELKKVQNPIDMQDILAYIFSIYPDLKSLDFEVISAPFFNSNSSQGTYVLLFGQKIQIKIANNKGVFDLLSYKNVQLSEKVAQPTVLNISQTTNFTNKLTGGYSAFQDLTDPIFMQVWRYFISQYSKYEHYEILSVQYQIVTGTNFMIKLKSPKEVTPEQHIRALVFYSLNGPIQVLELQVQGQIIDLNQNNYSQQSDKQKALQQLKDSNNQAYDYKSDPDFPEAYRFMISAMKIVNTIPILQVKRLESQQSVDFEIIYSQKQKSKVRKLKGNNRNLRKEEIKFQLIYYIVDGTDLASGKKVTIGNKTKVFDLIKQKKSDILKDFVVHKLKQTDNGYEAKLLSSTGIYNAEITSDSYDMHLTSLVQISQSNCYQYSSDQFTNSTTVSNITQFLKNNYGLNGSVFQLFQIQIKEGSKRYRVLYTDRDNKKIQVILQSFNGKLIVVQSLTLQEGYTTLLPGDQKIVPVQAISRIHFGEFIKNCQIRLRLTNQSHYKLIYSCPNKAFEYVYYPNQKTDKLQIIYQESSQDCQVQLHKENLIDLKQAVQDSKFIDIDNLARTKFIDYIQTSQVTDIEYQQVKDKNRTAYYSYKLYYKSTLGYYICDATWTNGDVRILNFILSTTQTNKNCQVLDQKTGICIKCLENYQLEFGKCYQKVQFCLIQTGDVCVQCDKRTLLRSGSCLFNCNEAFKLREQKITDQ